MEKNTINLIIFNFINSLTQFLVIVLLSRYCSLDEYASYRQVFLPFEIIAPLLGLGLSSSIFYFYPRFENKRKLLFLNVVLIFITSAFFFFAIIFGLDDLLSNKFNNAIIKPYLIYTAIFTFFSLSNTVLYSFLILENKTIKNVKINFFSNVILLISLTLIVLFSKSLEQIILLRVFIYALTFSLMVFYTKLYRENIFPLNMFILDLKEIFYYSLPVSLSLMVGVLSYQLDKFLVSLYCTTTQFAVYSNGAFEIPLIAIITSSLAGASFGVFTNLCLNKEFIKANELFKKITFISALFIFPCFVYLFYYAEDFITFVFGEKYSSSFIIFRIYLLLLPIRIIQYGNVLIALGKSKALLLRSLCELILNLIFSLLFFKIIGYEGIAYGTVVSVLFWTVPFNLRLISKGFNLPLFETLPLKKIGLIFLISIFALTITGIFSFLFSDELLIFWNLVISFLIFSALYLIFIKLTKLIYFDFKSTYKIKIY